MPDGEIPTKVVTVTITAEVTADAPMDPAMYQVMIKSTQDCWFDMVPVDVSIQDGTNAT